MDEPTPTRPADSIQSFFLWSTRLPEEMFMKAGFENMSLEEQRQFRQNWISHKKALAETIQVNKEIEELFRLARLQVRIEDRQALEEQAHTLRQNARYSSERDMTAAVNKDVSGNSFRTSLPK